MATEVKFARGLLASARAMLLANLRNVTLDEALYTGQGWRSTLGILKHLGGWLHVYRSFAFDPQPRHWGQTSWPRGLRDEIEASDLYFQEVVAWIESGFDAWDRSLAELPAGSLEEQRPVHWGEQLPLARIVTMVAHDVAYHTGEFNMLLSMSRGEAWEWGEEVEENHVDTFGHGVRGPWMSDDVARLAEERLRAAHERRTRR